MRWWQMNCRSVIFASMTLMALDSARAETSTNTLPQAIDPTSSDCLKLPFPQNLACNTTPAPGTNPGTVYFPGEPGKGIGGLVDNTVNPMDLDSSMKQLQLDSYMKQLNEKGFVLPQLNPSSE